MEIAPLIDAIGAIAWPAIAAVVLWKLFPTLRDLIKSRGLIIKIGNMEISLQEASDHLRTQVDDLQEKVTAIRKKLGETPEPIERTAAEETVSSIVQANRILWVDDNPSNNAYEIAKLQEDGIDIVTTLSTTEAMRVLTSEMPPIGLIITDMSRREEGEYRRRAGILLIEAARQSGIDTPILLYASARYLDQNKREVRKAGGNGATASQVELFEMIKGYLVQTA